MIHERNPGQEYQIFDRVGMGKALTQFRYSFQMVKWSCVFHQIRRSGMSILVKNTIYNVKIYLEMSLALISILL